MPTASVAEHRAKARAHGEKEGAFYVWDKKEIDAALGDRPRRFSIFITRVKPNGNVPAGGDPHGEFTGKNILIELGRRRGDGEAFQKR